jgi:hypothetical protein
MNYAVARKQKPSPRRITADVIAVFLLWVWCSEVAGPLGSGWISRTSFIGANVLSPTAFVVLRYCFGLGQVRNNHWLAALGIAWIVPFPLIAMKLVDAKGSP